jgi:hypothetical protein
VRRLLAIATLTLAALVMSSCGGVSHGRFAARVAGVPIYEQTVNHWARAIADGASPEVPQSARNQSSSRQALTFLINARWLLGETARRGFKPSASALARGLQEREDALGGRTAFRSALAASGQTLSDIRFEVDTQLAASALGRLVQDRAINMATAAVTPRVISDYYKAHQAEFRSQEQRDFDVAEGFHSKAAAQRAATRLGSGARFSEASYHESFKRPLAFNQSGGQGTVLRAVFAAKVGVRSPPIELYKKYVVFVLRRVRPSRQEPLIAVQAAIRRRLLAAEQKQHIAESVASLFRGWVASTDCSPRLIVLGCRQYSTSPAADDYAWPVTIAGS